MALHNTAGDIVGMTHLNDTPDASPSRKKYKYTQQLVKIALDELTQDEVAKLCRVSQSIVSGWLHGRSRAYEHQLTELRRRFGHRLHRATFRVYLAVQSPQAVNESGFDWEPYRVRRWTQEREVIYWVRCDEGEGSAEPAPPVTRSPVKSRASKHRVVQPTTAPLLPKMVPVARVVTEEHTESEWAADSLRVVQVEGPVTLRHALTRPAGFDARTERLGREPIGRWIVHHVGRERFVLVRQRRRHHHGPEFKIVEEAMQRAKVRFPSPCPVDSGDDAARWLSWVIGPCTASELLAHADGAATSEAGLLGASLLPFLVRKMLLELSYPVDGVERIGPAE